VTQEKWRACFHPDSDFYYVLFGIGGGEEQITPTHTPHRKWPDHVRLERKAWLCQPFFSWPNVVGPFFVDLENKRKLYKSK
jgi:hypothetical protein